MKKLNQNKKQKSNLNLNLNLNSNQKKKNKIVQVIKNLNYKHLFFFFKVYKNNYKIIKKKMSLPLFKRNSFFKNFLNTNFYKPAKIKKKYNLKRQFYKLFFKTKIKNLIVQKSKQYKSIIIKVKRSNIFCTYKWMYKNSLRYIFSAGKVGAKISKKNIRHTFWKIIKFFFKKIKKKRKNHNNTFFNIVAPKRIKKNLLILIKKHTSLKKKYKKKKRNKKIYRRKNIVIFLDPKKCFNGCRGKKQIRKKRNFYQRFKR